MKEMAIKEIAKMGVGSVDKILLGQTYGVPAWLFSGFKELVERHEPISRAEGKRLGGETVAALYRVRGDGMRPPGGKGKKNAKIRKSDNEDRIRREFERELKTAEGVTTIAATERPHIDESPRVPLTLIPVRHDKFYIEHIVFLVRSSFKIHAYKPVVTMPVYT
jgi:hypothetical protein